MSSTVDEIHTLAQAETIAGVKTLAVRGPASKVIDVFIIVHSLSEDEETALRRKCAQQIGSKSLTFDLSYGGTLVGLDFSEAGLTLKLFEALRDARITPHYILRDPFKDGEAETIRKTSSGLRRPRGGGVRAKEGGQRAGGRGVRGQGAGTGKEV
ncbi:hypothetical protein CMUS01_14794 [Colletotrichum musicola]|uniref:Uncharacterized protein n=1 Tax=Colletotrichum musicola TaxID=2175873 RepID=A0A8H6J197_9PEZI|nr:hypothetical protein CMUS01_14794 [Colletotrichum musicola]